MGRDQISETALLEVSLTQRRAFDGICGWLAEHPRITCALICISIYAACLLDRVLP